MGLIIHPHLVLYHVDSGRGLINMVICVSKIGIIFQYSLHSKSVKMFKNAQTSPMSKDKYSVSCPLSLL